MLKCLIPGGAGGILAIGLALVPGAAWAQANSQVISANEQQQAALQAQITQGISSGSLSAEQIAALQGQIQQLNAGLATATNRVQGPGSQPGSVTPTGEAPPALGRIGFGPGESPVPVIPGSPGNGVAGSQQAVRQSGPIAPTTTQTQTGPDPFTYNTLGPDAYAAQKYTNPGYTVPAYPTSNPQPPGTQQLTSGNSAGTPYGAGYAQAPGAGGALPQVYVYHPSSGR